MSDIRKQVRSSRTTYEKDELIEQNTPDDPFLLFEKWMQVAIDAGVKDANAFVLSTIANNTPYSRVVLLRDFDAKGFEFFTNYQSDKGRQLEENPQVAMNFFWTSLERQVRIKAESKKVSEAVSDEYFNSRPRESQLGAWASSQSDALEKREILEERLKAFTEKFEGKPVPRPDFWGGYLLQPTHFEFWQGRPSRLHDRIAYKKEADSWKKYRLYP
jgi:pyridoxamine 5'-phosphate oxidase